MKLRFYECIKELLPKQLFNPIVYNKIQHFYFHSIIFEFYLHKLSRITYIFIRIKTDKQ